MKSKIIILSVLVFSCGQDLSMVHIKDAIDFRVIEVGEGGDETHFEIEYCESGEKYADKKDRWEVAKCYHYSEKGGGYWRCKFETELEARETIVK